MYQIGVIALVLFFLGGAGYYIFVSDKESLLANTEVYEFAKSKTPASPINKEGISGEYMCDLPTGCSNIYTLVLKENSGADLDVSSETGLTIKRETGTWSVNERNEIVVSIIGTHDEDYDRPHSIFIRQVSTSTLSNLSFSEKLYGDMKDPRFIRR